MWKVVNKGTTPSGQTVYMHQGTFGKGRAKVTSWKIYRDGEYIGYASTAADAEVNFARALAGEVRDVTTGRWVQG